MITSTSKTNPHLHGLESAIQSTSNTPLQHAVSEIAQSLPEAGLTTNNVSPLLDALEHTQPYYRMALLESLVRSKALSNCLHQDAQTQFFCAKTVEQLPAPDQLLSSLGLSKTKTTINPEAVRALATLINRHMPLLIEDALGQNSNPQQLVKLASYLNTLVLNTLSLSNHFWQQKLDPIAVERINQLENVLCTKNLDPIVEKTMQSWLKKTTIIHTIQTRTLDPTRIYNSECNADEDIFMAMTERCRGWILKKAHPSLQANRAIVLAAVCRNGYALEYADSTLQSNLDVVFAAVRRDGEALKYADATLQANFDVVLAAVRRDGEALEYADATLQANYDVVLAAVQRNGNALEYASHGLKANKDIALAAVRTSAWGFKFVDEALKADKEVLLTALRYNDKLFPTTIIKMAHASLQNDPEILAARSPSGFY